MAIIEVVKYNGAPDVFAWKYPSEELGTWTQLIVNESQEALLFKGGQALDLFAAGRHTLETANIPILNNVINLPFGGRSPFAAEVWYINKVISLDIKWGTATPIQLQDPKYNIFIPLRSFGQFGIQIEDSRKFLVKLVGTMPQFDKETLVKYFRGLYMTRVKDAISSYLIMKKISILEINAYLDELSDFLQERILPTLAEYGIKLVNFYVNDINVPEDDSSVVQLKAALAKKAEMDIQGFNYEQERSFDVLQGAATNVGSTQSAFMGAGLGMGMGVGLGGGFGGQMGEISKNISTKQMKTCPKCSANIEADKRFCASCGCDTQAIAKEPEEDTNQVVCANCGHKYSKKAKFCPECGDAYNACTFCGADLKKDALSCHVCGKNLPKACPKCNALLPDNKAKFCPECGESLVKTCSKCGVQIDGSPKFCPECGNKV